MRYKAAITLHFTLLFFCLYGGAHGLSETPKQELSAPKIRIKDNEAIEWLRRFACSDCPTIEKNPDFYGLRGHGELLRSIKLNIKKPITVAGIEFDVPITIYLNNNLPNRIMTSDYRDPLPVRKSSIGLISAREIPVTPDGKIAKLKYPKRLFEMFEDKSSYSIAQFFWDSEDGQIGPTDFRTEKRVTVCGVTLEKGETIHYEWSDGYWGGPFKKPFKFKGRVLDPTEYILSFFYKDGCRVRVDNSKTGELITN